MKKTMMIFNPQSGKQNLEKRLPEILNILRSNGYDIQVSSTSYVGEATVFARQACVENYDMIIIIGGDGTFNECVNGLMEFSKRPLIGYIPAGTCCDIGMTLGLTKNPNKALRNILVNRPVDMDVVKANDRYFCYVSGNGAFVDISYVTDSRLKKKIGYLAYLVKGLEELFTIPNMKIKAVHDQGEINGRFSLILVINSKRVAGVNLIYKPTLDDGMVDVVMYRSLIPLNWLLYFISFLLPFWSSPLIVRFQTSTLRVVSNTRSRWNLDGECGGLGNQNFQVCKQAIQIIVPPKIKKKYFRNQEETHD
ncbi:MAG: diacylglycerol kinase family protein [Candidatus Izemoplasmatales bacterium]|nr:diacylglycerol kinase family lipid kinase [Acholeplasmataceae bacterium]